MRARQAFFPFYFLIVIFLAPAGCRPAPPTNQALAELYVKVLLLNQEYAHTDSSFSRQEYDKRIGDTFAAAGIDPAVFRSRLAVVAQSPDEYADFYERVTTILAARRTKTPAAPVHS